MSEVDMDAIRQQVAEAKEAKEEKSVEVIPEKSNKIFEERLHNVNEETDFSKKIQEGMVNIVKEAYANDKEFKDDIQDKAKTSAQEYANLEKDKAELERQNLQYASELLETQQALNEYKQAEHKWDNQRSRRQFVYDGVKPIMEWIGVKEPMNIFLMCFCVFWLIIPFIIGKPIEALIVGANPNDRVKQAKAWLWTLLALVCTGIVITAIIVPCVYFGVIPKA